MSAGRALHRSRIFLVISVLGVAAAHLRCGVSQDRSIADRPETEGGGEVSRGGQVPDRPIVDEFFPADGETGVGSTKIIDIFFNYPMDLDSLVESFSLHESDGTPVVGEGVFASGNPTIFSFKPRGLRLEPGTTYEVVLGTGARTDTDPPIHLAEEIAWTFSTAAE